MEPQVCELSSGKLKREIWRVPPDSFVEIFRRHSVNRREVAIEHDKPIAKTENLAPAQFPILFRGSRFDPLRELLRPIGNDDVGAGAFE